MSGSERMGVTEKRLCRVPRFQQHAKNFTQNLLFTNSTRREQKKNPNTNRTAEVSVPLSLDRACERHSQRSNSDSVQCSIIRKMYAEKIALEKSMNVSATTIMNSYYRNVSTNGRHYDSFRRPVAWCVVVAIATFSMAPDET